MTPHLDAPHFIGIDIGGTHIRMGLVSKQGVVSSSQKIVVGQKRDPASIIKILSQGVNKLVQKKRIRPVAIGMGVPGIVSADEGMVFSSPHFPDWKNFRIASDLAQKTALPIFIDNDANMIALGEMWKGSATDWPTFLMMTLGTGIGGGIVIDRKIFHGTRGFAGEFGHLVLQKNGFPCGCGSRGCFETLVSSTALIRSLKTGKISDSSLKKPAKNLREGDSQIGLTLTKLARQGNKTAQKIFSEMGTWLGMGLASLVNVTGIEKIVIGGGLAEAGDLYLGTAKTEMKNRIYKKTAEGIEIRRTQLGDEAGILGTALTCFEKAVKA